MDIKKISVLGCGWFGLPFAKELVGAGYLVNGSTTTLDKLKTLKSLGIEPFLINTDDNIYDDDFFKCDLMLINIPPRKKITDVNLYPTQLRIIAEKAGRNGVKQLIFISSSGIFEDGNFVVNEDDVPNSNTPAGIKLQLAEEVLTGNQHFDTTIIRFAGLIGPNRNLAKFFAGKTDIANGLAPINLIHLTDCIGICMSIIEQQAFGRIYHAVAPKHPTRQDFYTQLCQASSMPKPHFITEKNEWKQVESKNVSEVLAYEYVYADWDEYFKTLTD